MHPRPKVLRSGRFLNVQSSWYIPEKPGFKVEPKVQMEEDIELDDGRGGREERGC